MTRCMWTQECLSCQLKFVHEDLRSNQLITLRDW